MKKDVSKYLEPLDVNLNDFLSATLYDSEFQIVDLYVCGHTGFIKALIKSPSQQIIEKNVVDLVHNMEFFENFDKKTIRNLSYLAALEKTKPDLSIVSQQLKDEADDYIFGIKSRNDQRITKKSLDEIAYNKELLAQFNSLDSNRIGYLAGVKETVKECHARSQAAQTYIDNMPADYLNRIIEDFPELVYWKDENFIYRGCNKNAANLVGYESPSEIIGKSDIDLGKELNWSKKRVDNIRKTDHLIITQGRNIIEEDPIPDRESTKLYVTSKKPLYSNGKIVGILGISTQQISV